MGALTLSRSEYADKAAAASKALRSLRGEASSPLSPGNIWDDFCALGGGLMAGAARGYAEKVGPVPTDAAIGLAGLGVGVGWGSDALAKVGVGALSFSFGRWAENMVRETKERRAAASGNKE